MFSWTWRQYPKIFFVWVYISQLICFAIVCSRGLDGNIPKSSSYEYIFLNLFVLLEYVLVELMAISQNLLRMSIYFSTYLFCYSMFSWTWWQYPKIFFVWVYISQLICFAIVCSKCRLYFISFGIIGPIMV